MKQASGFAQEELKNTFNVDLDDKGKIVLNIGEEIAQGDAGFIKLKKSKRPTYYKVTGNWFVDTYHKINSWLLDNSKIKIKDKANFFNLLSVMLNAGLPLVKSLDALSDQVKKNVRFSRLIYELARSVEHGGTLSGSMRSYGDVFEASELGIIEAGEVSGQLNNVLENIGDAAEKSHEITSKVRGAMLYPAFIMCLLIGVMGIMFVYVIPQLKEFFTSSGNDLPMLTKIVVGISDGFVDNWKMIGIGLCLTLLFFILWKKTDQGKKSFDKLLLRMPIFGPIIKKMVLARFARNFSNLLSSDVAIISALQITAHTVGNEVYKEALNMAAEDLKQGIPLGESLKDNPLFPSMLVNIIEVGEKTAQIDTVTKKVAGFYESEVDTTINSLSRVIEPVLLVLIGFAVGTIVLAIMLPIISLTDFAASGAF